MVPLQARFTPERKAACRSAQERTGSIGAAPKPVALRFGHNPGKRTILDSRDLGAVSREYRRAVKRELEHILSE